jgi:dihydrofolate synthase/folylpolyglutamate synthase
MTGKKLIISPKSKQREARVAKMRFKIDTYKDAIAYIDEKSKLGSVPGLDSVTELLKRLGNPQDNVRCLHIAGTNGKGSVFAFVQTALTKGGYRVGRYVSPTVVTYLERFQLSENGKICYMPKEHFTEILKKVALEVSDMEDEGLNSPTAFEIETAVAYLYFAKENVDFALIECGMGGRLDATNVLSHPYLSVISSISLDHMQFLGDTLEKIAYEKAGIIKENGVCISAPQEKCVEAVLRDVCREKNAQLIMADKSQLKCREMGVDGTDFNYKGEAYTLSMLGEYQLVNAALAIEVLKYIKRCEEPPVVSAPISVCGENVSSGLTVQVIKAGLAETVWQGRFTIKSRKPLIIVDGAHNEAAWNMLAETLKKYFANKKFVFITGVLKDKEYEKMADILSPLMKYAVAITPDNPRGLKKEILQKLLTDRGVSCETADDAKVAYQKAYDWIYAHGDEDTGIVVCGSLSFLSEYLESE